MVSSVQLALLFNLILLTASKEPYQVNLTLLTDIINCASKYRQFDVIPIVAAQQTIFEIQEFIIHLERPIYILSVVRSDTKVPFRILHDTLTIAFIRGFTDSIFKMTDIFMRGRRLGCVLFVLTIPVTNHREIQRILIHAWSNNYMRAILLYRDYHGRDFLASYDVYDDFKLKYVMDDYRVVDVFKLRPVGNMNHHKILSPVKIDMPRVFEVTSPKGGKHFAGYSYHLFMTYVQYMNATFEEYQMTAHQSSANVVLKDVFQLITDGVIEISLHPFNRPHATGIQNSYPIVFSDICVMMPMANEVPSYMFLVAPFQFYVWLLVLFGIIYLTMSLMLIPATSSHRRGEMGLYFLQGLGYMLNISTWEYRHNTTWRYFFIHMACWTLGFFVTACYCAVLRTYWTTTAFGAQIDTIEDFLKSDWNILVKYEDFEAFDNLRLLPVDFLKRFITVDSESLDSHRTAFNTTYAYTISTDRWRFLNMQQQSSKRPLFRLSKICLLSYYISYQMKYDSRLQYSLNDLISYAQQSGLINYWMRSNFQYALREGYVKHMTDSYEVEPLRCDKLLLAFWMFAIGVGVSAVVFMFELMVQRLQRQWKRIMGRIGDWGRNQVSNYEDV